MINFICDTHPIPASRKRVVSIAFGDVDRIQLSSGQTFTGSAVLATVYHSTARYQYHVVFFSLSNRVVEIWHADPKDISITESVKFEAELESALRAKGISLKTVLSDSANFNVLLTRLPMSYDDENVTAPACGIQPDAAGNTFIPKLNINEEKEKLIDLFSQF